MKKKVLLIDDDRDLVRSFSVSLEANGFDVISANSGKEGFELFTKEKADLIVLDIMMDSKLDGYNTLHKFKEDPANKALPVIVLTGMLDDLGVNLNPAVEDNELLPNVRFQDKPIDPRLLVGMIVEMLQ
jgi:CheY-like chemotaxis protein